MRRTVLLAAAMAVAVPAMQCHGAGAVEELVVQCRLEETTPLELARYGNRVEVIDAGQIRLGGFNDLGQSLQMLVPGLYPASKNGAFDYVSCSLQGSRCQDILWLIDGVRINNRLYDTTSPLDTVPALDMGGRLEVADGFDWEVVRFARVDNLIGSANGVRINTDATVEFQGFELSAVPAVTERLVFSLDYLRTEAEAEASSKQIVGVPESQLKGNLTFGTAATPCELSLAVVHVGDVYDEVSGGIGRREHGNYTLVDVGAAWYPGEARAHRLSLRLENATDGAYASSLGRAFRDTDDSSYAYRNLGTPRTWHVGYGYRF